MNKSSLLKLIDRMQLKDPLSNFYRNRSWRAHRKAESLNETEVLPLLHELIEENGSKEKKEFRRNAYFIMAAVLKKTMISYYCQYMIDRLKIENDKYVLSAMLDGIGQLIIPEGVNIDPIIECSKDTKWLVRHSAIYALRATDTEDSRDAVRYWVRQVDEKSNKYELIYANAALSYIGRVEDIELLEMHTCSKIRDIRDSAQSAIESIQARIVDSTTTN